MSEATDPATWQPEPASPQLASGIHWYSAAQFGLSVLAVIGLWGMALSAVVAGLAQRLSGSATEVDNLSLFLTAGGMAYIGVLLLPSAGYAVLRLLGRPSRESPKTLHRLRPTLLIFVLPFLLLAGYWISQSRAIAWWLLPPVHILAVSLPILWLTYLGVRDLPSGTPQRAWGVFASGAVLAPLVIMVLEIGALIAGLIVWLGVIASSPELTSMVEVLADRLRSAPPSPEMALEILQPLLSNPAVLLSLLLFSAVIVPLVEEALKPAGVWLLAGRGLSPEAGFTAGVLSGTGYALVESLLLASGGGQDWTFLVFARIGTSTVHILTSGLVGWSLVLAWRQQRYLRLGMVYLLAVLIHGLWNSLTLITAFNSLTPAHAQVLADTGLGQIAPYLMVGIALSSFLTLLSANRFLARSKILRTEKL